MISICKMEYENMRLPELKNAHFTPNRYKGTVLKMGVQNYPFFSFMTSLSLKTLILPQIVIKLSAWVP